MSPVRQTDPLARLVSAESSRAVGKTPLDGLGEQSTVLESGRAIRREHSDDTKLQRAETVLAPKMESSSDSLGRKDPSESPPEVTGQLQRDVLAELEPDVRRACDFAEHWDKAYRPQIFRVALDLLLAERSTTDLGSRGEFGSHAKRDATRAQLGGDRFGEAARGPSQVEMLTPTAKIARHLNVDVVDVERAVLLGMNGQITVLAHIEGATKRELQTKFGLVYCFLREIALGDPLVDVEDLRTLCVEHGCYDLANFTGNFRKDVKAGLLREIGAKGARVRKYRLAKKGLDAAAELLREMVE